MWKKFFQELGTSFGTKRILKLLAISFCLAASSTWAGITPNGHRFEAPEGFSEQTSPAGYRFVAPEGDLSLWLVDLPQASDAQDAANQAWKKVDPAFSRKIILNSARPSRNGWTDESLIEYEASPSERLLVWANPRRASTGDGKSWVVILLVGSPGTEEKRAGPIRKFWGKLYAQGFELESFAGRKAKPLAQEQIEQLKSFVAKGMVELGVPGVGLSFISGNRVVWAGGLGVREAGKPQKVDANTLFMAASNTKAMTTALQAVAVDAGLIRWDQLASEADPRFRLGDPELSRRVLIRHLGCACTGMPRQDVDWWFGDPKAPAGSTFELLATMKPTSQFGEVFQYSNLMLGAAGYIAASKLLPGKEVGWAYDSSMRQRLFQPLGMNSSTFDFAQALRGNRAMPHGEAVDGKVRLVNTNMDATIVPARPAGGLWTSPHDFSQWVLMELARGRTPSGKVLISEANWAERYKPQIAIGADVNYGMGLFIDQQYGTTVISHGGDMPGFHSNMVWLPEHGLGMTILTNSESGAFLRAPLLRKLLEVAFDGRAEADERLRVAVSNYREEQDQFRRKLIHPVPVEDIKRLSRNYHNPELGILRVIQRNKRLVFQFRNWHTEVALHRNADASLSFVTIDPGIAGDEFILEEKNGTSAIILRDAQHEYRFSPRSQ